MLVALRRIEAVLVRVEGAAVVLLVATMLLLAGYNVFYRNVLVPLQDHYAHSGPPVEVALVNASPPPTDEPTSTQAPTKAAAEGFAGDWGEGGEDEEDEDEKAPEPAKREPAAEGFAGDWGEGGDDEGEDVDDADEKAKSPDDADDNDDDSQFENLPDIDAVAKTVDDGVPRGGPPPAGTFAAWFVELVDDVKIDWIDLLLRQLVILLAFFGGMLATVRSKHINVDVLSKLLRGRSRRIATVTLDVFAVGVCLVFADAGRKLVAMSREYENALVPWAAEWIFQLMYPIGFGLLAFHFAVRAIEHAVDAPTTKAGGA